MHDGETKEKTEREVCFSLLSEEAPRDPAIAIDKHRRRNVRRPTFRVESKASNVRKIDYSRPIEAAKL